MTIVKQALIELCLLSVAGVGVAFAANSMREKGRIQPLKNYFDKGTIQKPATTAPVMSNEPANAKPAATPEMPAKKLEHDFQAITVDEAHEVFDDASTEQGLNVFVDAREEEHYAEGHIPGAIQCFPYEAETCLDKVTAAAAGAEKVIVYCGGGDCEDSIFMCRELMDAGIPFEAIYLFEGGWKEWAAKGLHTETGMP